MKRKVTEPSSTRAGAGTYYPLIRFLIFAAVTLTTLGLLVTCSDDDDDPPPVTVVDTTPAFRFVECIQPLAPNSETTCGYMTVPEDRNNPDGPQIELYVSILPAADQTTATAPLFFLTGGPGATTETAKYLFENPDQIAALDVYRNTFGDNRDIVILDQRGTNQSLPALYCSEELAPELTNAYTLSYPEAATVRLGLMEVCYTRLTTAGNNLNGYNTSENAADVRDLALALGYDKANLFGASYGTRLVMETMKLYPDFIENAVIDSILPPEVNPFNEQALGTAYALGAFWQATAADFPNLAEQFYATIARLEQTPVPTVAHHYDSSGNPIDSYTVNVDGVMYVNYVVSQLRSTPINNALPANIVNMFNTQTYQVAAEAWLGTAEFLFPTGGPGTDADAFGMFESINGAADGAFTTTTIIEKNIDNFLATESLQTFGRQAFMRINADVMGLWPVDTLPTDVQLPLVSDIPTLMMVGSLDSATPEPFSWPSARFLPNSFYFEILAGHAVTVRPCAAQLLNNFLKDPSTRPEDPCDNTPVWTPAASTKTEAVAEQPAFSYGPFKYNFRDKK